MALLTFAILLSLVTAKTDTTPYVVLNHGRPAGEMLVINPDECIGCGLCVPECPVSAIFPIEEVPAQENSFALLAAGVAQQGSVTTQTPVATQTPSLRYAEEADSARIIRLSALCRKIRRASLPPESATSAPNS